MSVDVEIHQDGTLELHGYDQEYDETFSVLSGEPISECGGIAEHWDRSPSIVIDIWLTPTKEFRFILALDTIERFYQRGLLDKCYNEDLGDEFISKHISLIVEFVKNLRDHFSLGSKQSGSNIANKTINEIVRLESQVTYNHLHHGQAVAMGYAFGHFMDQIYELFNYIREDEIEEHGIASGTATGIALATAYAITESAKNTEDYRQVLKAEILWFIRRFVDTLEAYQAGLPWPDLGVTP